MTRYFLLAIAAVIAFAIHRTFFNPGCPLDNLLSLSYVFFAGLTFLLLLVLHRVRKKNLDYVGYAFLSLTFVKMLAGYAFYRFLTGELSARYECKMNFLAVFLFFLLLETYAAIKLLNSSQ
jgi:hypothetical protein